MWLQVELPEAATLTAARAAVSWLDEAIGSETETLAPE